MANLVEKDLYICIQMMQQHMQSNPEAKMNQQMHGWIICQPP